MDLPCSGVRNPPCVSAGPVAGAGGRPSGTQLTPGVAANVSAGNTNKGRQRKVFIFGRGSTGCHSQRGHGELELMKRFSLRTARPCVDRGLQVIARSPSCRRVLLKDLEWNDLKGAFMSRGEHD